MKYLSLILFLVPISLVGQINVSRTNCPYPLLPNQIVVLQSAYTYQGYTTGILGCYQLSSNFTIDNSTSPPTIRFGGIGSGTLTSLGLVLPSSLFSITGSPVTTFGNITASLVTQSPGNVFAGPTSGGNAVPTFRPLVSTDIPNLSYAPLTSGTVGLKGNGLGGFNNLVANDIISLWSGTCDSTHALYGDGTCRVAAGGATTINTLKDFLVTIDSPTLLTIGASCSVSTPCNVGSGESGTQVILPAQLTTPTGTGNLFIYTTASGGIFVGDASSIGGTCVSGVGCTINTNSAFPAESIPLYEVLVTSSVYTTLVDYRTLFNTFKIATLTGLIQIRTPGTANLAIDTSIVPLKIAQGSVALGTSAIASQACATVVTVAATGVVSTDVLYWNPNGSIKAVTGYVPLTTGGLSISGYPGTNTANFDVCNWTTSSITPGAITLNYQVNR